MASVQYSWNAGTNYYGNGNFATGKFTKISGTPPPSNSLVKSATLYFSNAHVESTKRSLLIRLNKDVDGHYILNTQPGDAGYSAGSNMQLKFTLKVSGIDWVGQLKSGSYYDIGMWSQIGSASSTGSCINIRTGSVVTLTINYDDPITACTPPTELKVDKELTDGNVTLKGSGAGAGTANSIKGYELQYRDSKDGTTWGSWVSTTTVSTTATSFSLSMAPPAPGYYRQWRARTIGSAGSSYYSGWKTSSNKTRCYAISTLTLSQTSVEAGTAITAQIGAMETSLTHRVKWTFAGASYSQDVAANVNTGVFTVPMEWLEQIPNAVSGTATCELTTILAGNDLGSKKVNFTITCPASVIPEIGSLTVEPINSAAIATWDKYLQGISKARVTLSDVTAPWGSSIASYSITGGGSNGTMAQMETDAISTSGTVTFTATAKDTRGRVATKTVDIWVTGYTNPLIKGFEAYRVNEEGQKDENGTRIIISAKYAYTKIDVDGVNSNKVYATVYANDTAVISAQELDADATVFSCELEGSYSAANSHSIQVAIKDTVGDFTAKVEKMINTSGRIMSIGKGKNAGVAFGKLSEQDKALEVAADWKLMLGDVDIGQELADKLDKAAVVNNLTTDTAGYALDARQGMAIKGLQDTKRDKDDVIPVSDGGTGATSAEEARSALEITPSNIGAAPTSHASSATTYGLATSANYGHTKLSTTIPAASSNDGSAGTANGLVANYNHRHIRDSAIKNSEGDVLSFTTTGDTYSCFRYASTNAKVPVLGTGTYRFAHIYLLNNPNVSSDEREKKDIAPIDEALKLIMGIEPVKFRRKEGEQNLHYGVIAQQLRDTVQGLGVNDSGLYSRDSIEEDIPNDEATEDQVRYGVYYTELIAPMLAVMQQQQRQIEMLMKEKQAD